MGVLLCVHACVCAPVCWCACVTPAVSQGPVPPAWNPDSTVLPALSCRVVDALGRHQPPTPAQDQEGGSAWVQLSVTGWERVLVLRNHQSAVASSAPLTAPAKLCVPSEPLLRCGGSGAGLFRTGCSLGAPPPPLPSVVVARGWEVWAGGPPAVSWP